MSPSTTAKKKDRKPAPESEARAGGKRKAGKPGKKGAAAKSGKSAKGGKKKPKKKAKKPPRFTAATADKYELYQLAVQSADLDVQFLRDTYRALRGKDARHLREDFCGTGLLSCEWVKLHPENTAEGYDLDPEPLDWGRRHNVQSLGAGAARVALNEKDCRVAGRQKPDVRLAQNFSYWILMERAELLDYFKRAWRSLADDGIFVVDIYGGSEGTAELEEEREIEEGFTYIWDQAEYFPGTGEFTCHIHFEFRDGTRMEKAFSYTWRAYGMPEIKDLLREAGFSEVHSYFEGTDEDSEEGEGNGEFTLDDKGENCDSWIAYVVAQK